MDWKNGASGNELQEIEATSSEQLFEALLADGNIQEGIAFLKADNEHTTSEQIELTAIPAPTFQEAERGLYYKKCLEELGIKDVQIDKVGNVFGIRPGTGEGPRLVLSAHLDTVFPEGTDTFARMIDGKVYAPGISDDGRGLAVVLTVLRALQHAKIKTKGDLIIGATVGEEGLGDLCGVKALFTERQDIDGFISIEPGDPNRIIYLATGSRRFHVTYKGIGGHSFGDFGIPSAIHALGRAIAKISEVEVPVEPKTTFNVGIISGGTSINTIAAEAKMLIDLRSTSKAELTRLEEKVLHIINKAAEDENNLWNSDSIQVEIKLVGDRPAGSQSSDSTIVKTALASLKARGIEPKLGEPSSTDSNVPISLGIPAITLGGGGISGGIHTLEEYFDPTDAYLGPQNIFLTVLGLIGVVNVTEPLLKRGCDQ